MMRRSIHKTEMLTFNVETTEGDIENGECRKPYKCMEKLAIERALRKADTTPGDHRVRVDAGSIRFHFGGYRYIGQTPRVAKKALIDFDLEKPVVEHRYVVKAMRTGKIEKASAERKAQINAARRLRIANGSPESKPHRYTLHERVVGFA